MTGAADWSARVGQVWADEWTRTERALADIAAVLDVAIDAVAPADGHAADLGCGVGSTTLSLAAARPDLRVTGIDLSEALVAVARSRAPMGRPTFVVGDVLNRAPELAPLDLLVSRHGVMFFANPVAAFGTLAAAVRPDAPLVFSCFRSRVENDWAMAIERTLDLPGARPGYAPGPFGLADPAFTTGVLTHAGWRDVQCRAHDVRYVVGTGGDPIADALAFFRRIGPAAAPLAAASPVERDRMETRLADLLAGRIREGAVTFSAAIWIWSARAGKEAA